MIKIGIGFLFKIRGGLLRSGFFLGISGLRFFKFVEFFVDYFLFLFYEIYKKFESIKCEEYDNIFKKYEVVIENILFL